VCSCLDVVVPELGSRQEARLIEHILDELQAAPTDMMAAYRGDYRWVQAHEPVRLAKAPGRPQQLRDKGTYLISGGLGRIGLAFAEYLARAVQARLVLVGRSALPRREGWADWLATRGEEDAASRAIRKVQELERLGAEVLVAQGDVADREQMRQVLTTARQRFGTLHGVIHAAGIVGLQSFHLAREVGQAQADEQFRPKARGLLVLHELLAGEELDFAVLLSSLAGVLGGPGVTAYGAANLFLDAFARAHGRASSIPWMSINWDGWHKERAASGLVGGADLTELVLSVEEGVEAFGRLLATSGLTQVAVSTGDLPARLERWVKPKPAGRLAASQPHDKAATHARPELATPFAAPRDDLERTVVQIWQELFGIDRVGVHDNFFDLGGTSLTAIQLMSRLRSVYEVVPSLQTVLFQTPTVAGLAQAIAQTRLEQVEAGVLDEVLKEVEGLPPQEVEEALTREFHALTKRNGADE